MALDRVRASANDLAALIDLADAALDEQREADALPILEAAAEKWRTEASLWQWTALLHRGLDSRLEAILALERAIELAPHDVLIAHSYARICLEAGFPSAHLFENAMRLSPNDGGLILGWGAALLAGGRGEFAIEQLDQILQQNPGWLEGHNDLIQLRTLLNGTTGARESLERAIADQPGNPALRRLEVDGHIRAEQFEEALRAIRQADLAGVSSAELMAAEAVACSEIGNVERADILFAKFTDPQSVSLDVQRVRHLLRNGRIEAALTQIEVGIAGPNARDFWPYASVAWRLCGDEREDWLDGSEALVSVMDLSDQLPELDTLTALVRKLHRARHQHFDQSVRGGTQTDGALFSRVDPEIRALRTVVMQAVADHVARLPPADAAHPTLSARRGVMPRFNGSWSVRLKDRGYHSNHVHPAGWISSAFYLDLPAFQGEEGWLALGEPQASLNLGLAARRVIQPVRGRLVLFPSTMWHGTLPFEQGERLTIAFDVQRPLD